LRIARHPYPHVPVGEEGRGRKMVRVPLAPSLADTLTDDTTCPDDVAIGRTPDGRLLILPAVPGDPRALVLLAVPAGYRGSTQIAHEGSVTVLAEGYCAEGQAGRMGGHAEQLLLLEPGARVTVTRRGRLYGACPTVLVVYDGELRAGAPDEVEPPAAAAAAVLI
jgi:hypothetical protein